MNNPDETSKPQAGRKEADNSLFSMFGSNFLQSMFSFVMGFGMMGIFALFAPLRHWWCFFFGGMVLHGPRLFFYLLHYKKYQRENRFPIAFDILMDVMFYTVGSLCAFGALERWFPLD